MAFAILYLASRRSRRWRLHPIAHVSNIWLDLSCPALVRTSTRRAAYVTSPQRHSCRWSHYESLFDDTFWVKPVQRPERQSAWPSQRSLPSSRVQLVDLTSAGCVTSHPPLRIATKVFGILWVQKWKETSWDSWDGKRVGATIDQAHEAPIAKKLYIEILQTSSKTISKTVTVLFPRSSLI